MEGRFYSMIVECTTYIVTIYKGPDSFERKMGSDTLCELLVHGDYDKIKIKTAFRERVVLKREG